MNITPPRDSTGAEALRATNAQRVVTETPRVEPKKAVPSSEEWHGRVPVPSLDRRSGRDRRKQDRRKEDQESPVDTREQHDRRRTVRRAVDRAVLAARSIAPTDDETPTAAARGIDTYA